LFLMMQTHHTDMHSKHCSHLSCLVSSGVLKRLKEIETETTLKFSHFNVEIIFKTKML